MKTLVTILSISLVIFFSGCDDCTDCEPFTSEPYLTINFLNQADSSRRIIIIDSINHQYAPEIRFFEDTTNVFKFPLDMHNNISEFTIVYRDTSQLDTYHTNIIGVDYQREFIRRDDNYMIIECSIISFSSDFAQSELYCDPNDEIKCISNEASAKVYN